MDFFNIIVGTVTEVGNFMAYWGYFWHNVTNYLILLCKGAHFFISYIWLCINNIMHENVFCNLNFILFSYWQYSF